MRAASWLAAAALLAVLPVGDAARAGMYDYSGGICDALVRVSKTNFHCISNGKVKYDIRLELNGWKIPYLVEEGPVLRLTGYWRGGYHQERGTVLCFGAMMGSNQPRWFRGQPHRLLRFKTPEGARKRSCVHTHRFW